MKASFQLKRPWHDLPLFWLTFVASVVGLLLILDAGFVRSIEQGRGNLPREFKVQLAFLGLSLVFYWWSSMRSGHNWRRFAWVVWFLAMGLLVLPKTPLGYTMNNATRWFMIGPIRLQPSEFIKGAAILLLATTLANHKPWPSKPISLFPFSRWLDRFAIPKGVRAWPFILVLVAAVMVEMEPDMGTAMVLVTTAFFMLILGGVSARSLGLLVVFGVVFVVYVAISTPYRLERILAHPDRWSQAHMDDVGYQTVQSEIGMASGGFISLDFGGGRTKHMIPAPTTDFIMATVAEETGFVGSVAVIGLLGAIVYRLFQLGRRTANRAASLYLYGVGSWIGLQSAVNICMANALLPPVGIPLPFLSSGGSSLAALWITIGASQAMLQPAPKKAVVEEGRSENRRERRWDGRTRLSRA